MNATLRLWFRVRSNRRRADQLLLALDYPARRQAVCEAMFHLNHLAQRRRRTEFAEVVYRLKNQLVEHLYKAGHCESATLHRQILKCYCGGDDECEKCEGTGIYRQFKLYYFRFNVFGQTYVWHQPERLVTWPVTLTTTDTREYEDRERDLSIPDGFDLNFSAQLVNDYLNWYGLGEPLPPLLGVLLDLARVWLKRRLKPIRFALSDRVWSIRRAIAKIIYPPGFYDDNDQYEDADEYGDQYAEDDEEEIPF